MARNMANRHMAHPNAAQPLLIWNRSAEKSERLLKELGEHKIKIASSPEDLARDCDIIFTNLANDTVVKDTFLRFSKALEVCAATCLLHVFLKRLLLLGI